MNNTITLETLKAFADDHAAEAVAILAAQAAAETVRAKVETYKAPLIEKYRQRFDYDTINQAAADKSIRTKMLLSADTLTERNMFLLHGEDNGPINKAALKEYYAELHELHLGHGFREMLAGKPAGFCPALILENEHKRLLWQLVGKFKEFLGVEADAYIGHEKEKEMTKLVIDVCIKRAGELGLTDVALNAIKEPAHV